MSTLRVGIVGGGQLARMLTLAGAPLGMSFVVLDPARDACAGLAATRIVGAYDDERLLSCLAAQVDVVTFDFENVPEAAARKLAALVPVYPPPEALAASQDRLIEKQLFNDLGIPTAPFAPVSSAEELAAAARYCGIPAILKTRRLGYDGKGQRRIGNEAELQSALASLDDTERILEGMVNFEREVSLLVARGQDRNTVCYPLVENVHRDGILHCSRAPYDNQALFAIACGYAGKVLDHLNYVGVLAIEFFVVDNQLIANEMAPRVHNSGHWTIEGAETSQFENHLRAVTGLPLGSPEPTGYSAMLNFIGELPDSKPFFAQPGCHFHSYDKAPRPGRKVGHATVRANTIEQREIALGNLKIGA